MPGCEKINNSNQAITRILIAPLDWGLGHTTRCIPIIKAFASLGAEISLAGNAKQAHLLRGEFQSLDWIYLDGYDLSYSKSSLTTHLKLFLQIPKILTAIKRENKWLHEITRDKKFDVIISDNRFGLHHEKVHSIFITHQLRIRIPFSKWLEKKLQSWNYGFIKMFHECWVPDKKDDPNLAGELAHPQQLPALPVTYIGPLSRFVDKAFEYANEPFYLFMVSGPEPQRTVFEEMIEKELRQFDGKAIVIRGLPGEKRDKKGFKKVAFINHLPTSDLNKLIQQASFVICRSGYSSIMDLMILKKKSIIIPTPGQTEQEYLAAYLMNKKFCFAVDQKNFSLHKVLHAASNFDYADMSVFQQNELLPIVADLVNRIVSKTFQVDGISG